MLYVSAIKQVPVKRKYKANFPFVESVRPTKPVSFQSEKLLLELASAIQPCISSQSLATVFSIACAGALTLGISFPLIKLER